MSCRFVSECRPSQAGIASTLLTDDYANNTTQQPGTLDFFRIRNLESLGYRVASLRIATCSRFSRIPICDRQTDTHKHGAIAYTEQSI